jgi:site-specific DNA-methyltransferase (adenine-specific)
MQILNGNNLDLLKTLADNSVDSIVTDPPYGLSFMNKKWDYDVPSVELWKEVYRVLKHGGHVVSFGGTRTYHRMVVNIEDAGFEIRDQIMWLYGSGFPKSLNIGKAIDKIEGNHREVVGEIKRGDVQKAKEKGVGYLADVANRNNIKQFGYGTETITKGSSEWEGWGTALKPANEPICLARKPLSEKSVAENVLKYGTGGINIDGCRLGDGAKKWETPKGGIWKTDSDAKSELIDNPQGRFPANVIHDGSEEVLQGFPNTGNGNGGKPYNYSGKEYDNKKTSMFNGDKPQAPSNFNDSGNASRFFYCAKASKSDRNEGCDNLNDKHFQMRPFADEDSDKSVLKNRMNSKSGKNHHPTVKPTELMRYLCRLITPPNGIVLDPFMGSGSTGKGAILEGFDFIGMELDPEYVEIAKSRIEYAQKEYKQNLSQQKLF